MRVALATLTAVPILAAIPIIVIVQTPVIDTQICNPAGHPIVQHHLIELGFEEEKAQLFAGCMTLLSGVGCRLKEATTSN